MVVAQGRVCALCGEVMEGEIHADHIQPFSKGGTTKMENGQAVHASCNLKKGARTMETSIYKPQTFSLRAWQRDFLNKFSVQIGNGAETFSLQAWPGAGKTKIAVCAFKTAQLAGRVDKLLWIVPSSSLKKDIADRDRSKDLWGENISAVHDIPNAMVEESISRGRTVWPQDKDAWLVTYSQVATNPYLYQALCKNFRVMVVMDEAHHCKDKAVWGEKIRTAVELAKIKLPMSGTLFPTDGASIPFVASEESIGDDGQTVRKYNPDYTFSMKEALACQPGERSPSIRPLTYIKINASGEFTYRNLETEETFTQISDLKEEGEKAKLTPLLSIDSEMVYQMLKSGIDALDGYRDIEGDNAAGGLIVCMDGKHARAVARFMQERFEEDPLVVLHDTEGASDAINNFRKSTRRWLITVRMVTEGVDIKRLRVGVYLSNYLTYLFLIQWLGRMWRWSPILDETQQGTAIIPAHETLVEWISELENATYEAVVKDEGDDDGPDGGGGGNENKFVLEDFETQANIAGGHVRGNDFDLTSWQMAGQIYEKLEGTLSQGLIASVWQQGLEISGEKGKESFENSPALIEERQRQKMISHLGRVKGQTRMEMLKNPPQDWKGDNPYSYIEGKLNAMTGVASFREKISTLDDIKMRHAAAKALLGRIHK